MLKLVLSKAHALAIVEDNYASRKVIKANGGRVRKGSPRYWLNYK